MKPVVYFDQCLGALVEIVNFSTFRAKSWKTHKKVTNLLQNSAKNRCLILLLPIWLQDFILFLCVQPYFKVYRLGCFHPLASKTFFSDLLTTQTHTIRRGALRFAIQISPLLNYYYIMLQSLSFNNLKYFFECSLFYQNFNSWEP